MPPAADRTPAPPASQPATRTRRAGATTPARARGPAPSVAPASAGPAIKLAVAKAAKDPRFRQAMDKLEKDARQTKQHPPAGKKAAEAQAAALPPANERVAGAEANQVDILKEAPTQKPDADSFVNMLRAEIQRLMPKKVEDTEDYMKGDDRQQLKSAMTGNINQQKAAATGDLKAASSQPPDPSTVPGKEVTPLPTEEAPAPPPPIGAAQAMPAPASQATVEAPLQQSKRDADKLLIDNKITPQQLQKANDPRFSAVLRAKSNVEKNADAAPKAYRTAEHKNLAAAAAKASVDERLGRAAFAGVKGHAGAAVRARQLTAKEKDEAERKKVADHIEGIFTRIKATVERKLENLESEVTRLFDQGADAAVANMRDYVETRFDDRYSGVRGKARWLRDKLLPLPDGVKAWFTEAHAIFLQDLDALVVRVANLVETRLKEAKDEVARGQKEVHDYVQGLPASLQAVGKAAEREVQGRFDELRHGVDEKKQDLAQKLAQRYKEASDKGDAALQELVDKHKSLTEKLAEFVGDVIRILGEFKDKLMAVFRKGVDTIMLILSDPIGFLSNLLSAIKKGFGQFVDNIWTHLKAGFMAWLFGALAGAGITLPKDFSLPSILHLVLQILGLTPERIRAKAVKLIGERNVMLLEKAWELILVLIKGSPAALWEKIKEYLSNLKEMVIDAIQGWLITTVIKAAVTKIVTMFNPVGAIVQAVIMIYNTVMFVIERAKQIAALIEAVVNSVSDIASGAIAAAANWIEQALARLIPVVIGFLAALLGLGGITEKIRSVIQKIQATVDQAIDKVIDKIVGGIKKLVGIDKAKQPGDARMEARKALVAELREDHTRDQVEKIAAGIEARLKPLGVKRIQVGPPNKEGDYEILVEASALAPEVLMTLARKGYSVRLAGTVRFATPQTLETARRFTSTGKPFPLAPGVAGPPGAIHTASISESGVLVLPSAGAPRLTARPEAQKITSDVVQVATYNRSVKGQSEAESNDTHAETQFISWFKKDFSKEALADLEAITIRISRSPCGFCVHDLCKFINNNVKPYAKNVKALELSWASLHEGDNPTTVEDFAELKACFTSISGDEPKITRAQAGTKSRHAEPPPGKNW